MKNIKAHASWFTEESGYILVIDDDMYTLDGYHCLNNLTNDEPKELQRR